MDKQWINDNQLHFGVGIENTFVPQSSPNERALDEYELTEHYQQYDSDFKLAAEINSELIRWGIPWHRLQSDKGSWDWEWTDRAVDSLLEKGLTPIIDLLHYGVPLWLENEFINPDFPHYFSEFSQEFAKRYGDRCNYFTPVNEPMIHSLFCGEYGYWPPYLEGKNGFTRVAVQLAKAIALSQKAIFDISSGDPKFIHVEAAMDFQCDTVPSEHDQAAEMLRNQVYFVEDLVTGKAAESNYFYQTIQDIDILWFEEHKVRPDAMGVNYYPRNSTELFEKGVNHSGGFADPRPHIDTGVSGLRRALLEFYRRYDVPVLLSETCVEGSVAERFRWMKDSVYEIRKLRKEGVPVIGYIWWPLFDMYEWTWRHSVRSREAHKLPMGLFDLVETSKGLQRERNDLAKLFTDIQHDVV